MPDPEPGASYCSIHTPPRLTPTHPRPGCHRVRLDNYRITFKLGAKSVTTYSPITASIPSHWIQPVVSISSNGFHVEDVAYANPQEWIRQTTDVSTLSRKTTLGPYSFREFVDFQWTSSSLPKGRRPLVVIGKAHVKRPLKCDALPDAKRRKKSKKGSSHDDIDESE